MDQQLDGPQSSRDMVAHARELRDAAVAAGRPDVVGKAEEAIRLITAAGPPADGDDKANVVVRVLDGLGF